MPRSRLIALVAVAALALAAVAVVRLAEDGRSSDEERGLSATQPVSPPESGDAAVIRAWADTLAGGDAAGAARLFALPAVVQPDPAQPGLRMTKRAQVRAFNAALPCGATLLRTVKRGRYTVATFRLIERVGGTCDAPGATAATAFLIRGGRIVEWRRVPTEPPTAAPTSGSALLSGGSPRAGPRR